eukprot:6241939-Prymnesium_polylepis.1
MEDSDSEAEDETEEATAEETEEDNAEEEDDGEQEELDAEAQVAKAVAAERARIEAELAAAQAAAQADTTSTLDPGDSMRVAVDPGALVAFARRYHRVTIKAEDDCITEFPPNGGLEHSFRLPADHPKMPELLPIDSEATSKEQKQRNKENKATNLERVTSATRAVLDQQLNLAGFKPTEETGMNTIMVHPRVGDAPPVSNKVKFAWLVDANSVIELDMNAVAGAQKRSSFALKPTTRKMRKLKLLKQRQDDRVLDLAAAMEERPEIVQQKRKTTESVELKMHLRGLYTGSNARSLRGLGAGEYPIVAIRVHEAASDDKAHSFDIFLQTGTVEEEATTEPFKATDAINAALRDKALALVAWYNTLGDDATDKPRHGIYYLNPNNTMTAIGTFVKTDSRMVMSNGKAFIDCGISIGDVCVMQTAAQQRELHAVGADVGGLDSASDKMDTDAPSPNKPLPLLVTDGLRRSADYIGKEFPVGKDSPPRVLTVTKMCVTDYYGHKDKVMLEVTESASGKTAIVWGGVTINERMEEITRDCVIIVRKVLQRNTISADIVAADAFNFTHTLPKYSDLPALRKGGSDGQPPQITIAGVGSIKVDKACNPVIQDQDGNVWRFAAPQNIKANPGKKQVGLKLQKGSVLDTIKMTIISTGSV